MASKDLVKEARELLASATDYVKRPMLVGRITRCEIGGLSTIASHDAAPVAYVADHADAQLLARAPELLSAMADEIERLRGDHQAIRESVDTLVNSDFVCSRCGNPKK